MATKKSLGLMTRLTIVLDKASATLKIKCKQIVCLHYGLDFQFKILIAIYKKIAGFIDKNFLELDSACLNL
jgi:hypothetical protein